MGGGPKLRGIFTRGYRVTIGAIEGDIGFRVPKSRSAVLGSPE